MPRGRRRKTNVKRTPSGRISQAKNVKQEMRETKADAVKEVAVLQRVRRALYHECTHPWAGFPLGRLACEGYLTVEQFRAGSEWAHLTYRAARIDGIPLPLCKAARLRDPLGRDVAKDPPKSVIDTVRQRKRYADMIIATAGARALTECEAVIIRDEDPNDRQLLRKALAALAALATTYNRSTA